MTDPRQPRKLFRLPFTRARIDSAVDDELRFHIEGRIAELRAAGMSQEEAEAEARRRFGDYDNYRQETRRIDEGTVRQRDRMELTDTLRRETKHAAATLLRSRAFSLMAFVTLALGLGAATTIYTLLDRVVIRPLPYPDGDRLVHIGTLWPFVRPDAEFRISRGQFFFFKEHSRTLQDIGLYDEDMMPIPGDGAHPTERVHTLLASASLFHVLGIAPELGRLFTAEEGIAREPGIALISHEYWQRRYGADPNILKQRIVIDSGMSIRIIGVLPAGARVPEGPADIWMPNWLDPSAHPQNNHTHSAIAVAKPGVTIQQVDADIKQVEKQFEALWPDVYPPNFLARGFAIHVSWLRDQIVGDKVSRALWILFAAVGVVLLIAAANVANLFLVRIDARRREVAVRTALGASRGQLAVHFLAESGLLALAAAIGAVFISYALLHVLVAMAPSNLPRLDEVALDWRHVTFCFGVALVSALVLGALPLFSRSADMGLLREGGRGLTTSRASNTARRSLVVSQVALAVVLVAAAALMVKSYARLRQVRPGFDPDGVTAVNVSLPYAHYPHFQQTSAFWRQLLERVDAIPGVVRAGATEILPLIGESGCTAVGIDAARNSTNRGGCVPTAVVSPGYFETMGIRVSGTSPDWTSTYSGIGPVVVAKAYADQFFPDEDAVGHGVRINSNVFPFFRVVGVAEDVRANGLQKPPVNFVYFPLVPPTGAPGWDAGYGMTLVVRAPTLATSQVLQAVRAAAAEIDRQVAVDEPLAMESVVARSMAQTSFTMLLLLVSAGIALVLSAVGLYGVVSYVVSQRRSEIGIRMALGAREREVTTMVLMQAVVLAVVGIAAGVAGALAVTRAMTALLYEVAPNDPAVIALTCVALLAVTAIASLLPARRAARVDPVEALRGS